MGLYYAELKAYRKEPTPEKAKALDAGFDTLFGQQTGWATLDRLLRLILRRKKALLLVLARLMSRCTPTPAKLTFRTT